MLHIVRVRRQRRTGEPLIVTDAWLPAHLTDTLTESALVRTALYELLSDAGVVVDRVQHEATARSPARAMHTCSTRRSAPRCCASTVWRSWTARRIITCQFCCRRAAVVW